MSARTRELLATHVRLLDRMRRLAWTGVFLVVAFVTIEIVMDCWVSVMLVPSVLRLVGAAVCLFLASRQFAAEREGRAWIATMDAEQLVLEDLREAMDHQRKAG